MAQNKTNGFRCQGRQTRAGRAGAARLMDVAPRVGGHRALQAAVAVAQVHGGAHIPAARAAAGLTAGAPLRPTRRASAVHGGITMLRVLPWQRRKGSPESCGDLNAAV